MSAKAPDHRYDIVALVSNDLVTDQRMRRCLRTLTDAGYDCLLLGHRKPASRPLDLTQPFAQERHAFAAASGKTFYARLNLAHYRRLLRLRPRAILGVDVDTAWAARRAARRLGVPWVFDAHELFLDMPEVRSRWWIRAAWRTIARRTVPTASAAYTVGGELARVLTERYGLEFHVVKNFPESVSEPAPRQTGRGVEFKVPSSPFTILYQGALNVDRGLEELIEATGRLPGVRTWIAGAGPLGEDLRARAERFGDDRVEFFGELTPDELRRLTPRADLGYALMRNTGLSYYYSLSNKSVDYVQAGLPSVQMDWPEYAALQREHGCYHLVGGLTVDEVVRAVEACREPVYYASLVRACGSAAPHLTWASEARALLAVWARILPSRPPPH